MKITIIDDERIAIDDLIYTLDQCADDLEIESFDNPKNAMLWLTNNTVDIVFLDINMGNIDGLEFAKKLKKIQPNCAIIFVTGYSQHALEAFSIHVSGYLLKPVRKDDLLRELDYVKNNILRTYDKKLQVKCFGNFEIYYEGIPVKFSRSKSKELLAYLIDRSGAGCTLEQIANILWEDGLYNYSRRSQIHNFLSDITKTINEYGYNIINHQYNYYSVNKDCFSCDYYRYLDGDDEAISSYLGEYMAQYSWAEYTNGLLSHKILKDIL